MGRKISTKNSDGRSPQIEPGAATCSHDLQPLDLPNEPEFRPDAPPCDPDAWRLFNLVTVARLIARAALRRQESRGAHFRQDFPKRNDERWKIHVVDSASAETPKGTQRTQR